MAKSPQDKINSAYNRFGWQDNQSTDANRYWADRLSSGANPDELLQEFRTAGNAALQSDPSVAGVQAPAPAPQQPDPQAVVDALYSGNDWENFQTDRGNQYWRDQVTGGMQGEELQNAFNTAGREFQNDARQQAPDIINNLYDRYGWNENKSPEAMQYWTDRIVNDNLQGQSLVNEFETAGNDYLASQGQEAVARPDNLNMRGFSVNDMQTGGQPSVGRREAFEGISGTDYLRNNFKFDNRNGLATLPSFSGVGQRLERIKAQQAAERAAEEQAAADEEAAAAAARQTAAERTRQNRGTRGGGGGTGGQGGGGGI